MNIGKTAFGVIVRDVDTLSPYIDFLKNASRFGYEISYLIIVYNNSVDKRIIKELGKYTNVVLIHPGDSEYIAEKLIHLGLSHIEADYLIETPFCSKYNMISYGTMRNYVMLTALFLEADHLIYFDSDVYPKILNSFTNENEYLFHETDFVGNHMKILLSSDDIVVTTGDYTGYYVVPKLNFPKLYDLLFGMQKEDQYERIVSGEEPVIQRNIIPGRSETHKIIGGNCAVDLSNFNFLPPFHSNMLVMDNECFLGRGEDTLFGPVIQKFNGRCIDIDMKIFHNCFGDFPNKPSIVVQKNIDRFYYACMGWIIRNPFYNFITKRYTDNYEEIDIERRYKCLELGSIAAAEYFSEERFLNFPKAFGDAYDKIENDTNYFYNKLEVWDKMKSLLRK